MGKKLKRYGVYKKTTKGVKSLGQEMAYSKSNANNNVKERWGNSAFVRQIKY